MKGGGATPTSSIYPGNFLRFLGTSGARFCTMHQIRSSGGIFFRYGGFAGVLDPGPGSLHQICRAVPELDPTELDGVIISHRHLDHCGDANAVVEAMVGGGFNERGSIFLPKDALSDEPVVFGYLRRKVGRRVLLEDGGSYPLGEGQTLRALGLKHHGVTTFGFVLSGRGLRSVGIVSDTSLVPQVFQIARSCQVMVVNVTLERRRPNLDHLSLEDLKELLSEIPVPLVLLTHMGRGVLRLGPDAVASMFNHLSSRVICGEDGMVVDLDSLEVAMMDPREPREGSHSWNQRFQDL